MPPHMSAEYLPTTLGHQRSTLRCSARRGTLAGFVLKSITLISECSTAGIQLAHWDNVISTSAAVGPHCPQNFGLPGEKCDRGHAQAPAATESRIASPNSSITHRLLGKRLFPGTRRRFLLRLASASPQLRKIQSAWQGLLAGLELKADAEEALSGLDVERLYGYLRSGDLQAFESGLEQLGQDLANRDVPEEYALGALGLFFEVCLCGALGEPREDKEYALGLARLASVSQLVLASGYANHRAASRQSLEDRLQKAEERAEALAIRVSEANEKERRRLSSDLHDEIGHDLVVLKLYLEMIFTDVKEKVNHEVSSQLAEAIGLSTRAIEAVRRLAFDLGPGIFDDCGFVPAIRNYARRFTATTGVKARVRISHEAKLEAHDELALYRVLQGSLSNVLKHSRAKE